MKQYIKWLAAGSMLAMCAGGASAQSSFPDTSNHATVTATVGEQATISLPSEIGFTVSNVSAITTTGSGPVGLTNIALAADKRIRISMQADASAFTAPTAGAVTWDAADVSWNTGIWTNGTGAANTLSSSAYSEIATSTANPAGFSGAFTFSLAAKPTVNVAGDHVIHVTWKVESI